ncbi:ROK family protein [Mycetocola spongiae]|uniref:ROK family protein n=1 Tax=Mycetocola spongiae TaxID=2859226 RepID=UPI001CF120CD|nr:ROK family protein [Mycetocola spongiae]UCR88043.1 ROK family protein [Mycetocola spongiae]
MSATPPSGTVLALDIGGTKVEAALVDHTGALRPGSRFRVATGRDSTREALLHAIDSAVTGTLATAGNAAEIVGCGIGSAGPISLGEGTVSPLNLPALRGFGLVDFIGQRLAVPTTLRLDGTCIALAEHWLGATRGARNSLAMIVSTGVGGGLILGGRLFSGDGGNAGHIGQVQVATREPGHSAARASLEALASGPRIVEWARERGWAGQSGEELAADYAAGVPLAREAVRRSTTAVGEAIAGVATLLDLHHVAIGGGFMNVAADYIERVAATIREAAIFDYAREVTVSRSGLSDEGPLIGAAALIHRRDLL